MARTVRTGEVWTTRHAVPARCAVPARSAVTTGPAMAARSVTARPTVAEGRLSTGATTALVRCPTATIASGLSAAEVATAAMRTATAPTAATPSKTTTATAAAKASPAASAAATGPTATRRGEHLAAKEQHGNNQSRQAFTCIFHEAHSLRSNPRRFQTPQSLRKSR